MSSLSSNTLHEYISKELSLPEKAVKATLDLFDDGATVPFIARYRKERTGSLDEEQIRSIRDRASYLKKLDERKEVVLRKIEEQGKLTEQLRQAILTAATRVALEDLYLPYKPRKQSRAKLARKRGLEPLAAMIGEQGMEGDPREAAATFVDEDKDVVDVEAALAGARDILAEAFAERGDVRALVRKTLQSGQLTASSAPGESLETTKYKDYASFAEPIKQVKPHRYLAVKRGENEGKLKVRVVFDFDTLLTEVIDLVGVREQSPMAEELRSAAKEGLNRLIVPTVEREVRGELLERSEKAAIDVFATNLRDLLLASPLGARAVVGIDPGLRTGCKVAALDGGGALIEHDTVPLTLEGEKADAAAQKVKAIAEKLGAAAVAVGTGTGGREAFSALRSVINSDGPAVVPVNEAGASVYSASKLAREELPDVDVTIRGAVSIGRRLQDPLAELVKIDPRSIGVGQYQHDVNQKALRRRLDDIVESCVNRVGVDANTASPSLLRYVAGIGPKLARKLVEHRAQEGPFTCREELMKVAGLGPKVFEQAAGFLRIRESKNPLDNSAVHPERYELVAKMVEDLRTELATLVGNKETAAKIDISAYVSDDVGEPTLKDIIAELCRPGRDPRKEFSPPAFRDDVREIKDLEVGMVIEGVVTNVTDFGAFVDIGVHQDGLVHISQLADRFVSDPREVVKVGHHIKVRVIGVDLERTRISLSARPPKKGPPDKRGKPRGPGGNRNKRGQRPESRQQKPHDTRQKKPSFANTPFADLLQKLDK